MKRKNNLLIFMLSFSVVLVITTIGYADALPSWNENNHKQAIYDYVAKVTDESSPFFIAPIDRIAVFDNDGTVTPEKPYSFIDMFAMLQAKKLHANETEWQNNEWIQKLFDSTPLTFDEIRQAMPAAEFEKIFAAGNAGQTQEQVDTALHDYVFNNTMHPRWHKPPAQLAYKPMIELIKFLRANQFTIYFMSGSTTDYLRQFSEVDLGISKSNVIGWDYVDVVKYDENNKMYLFKTTTMVVPASVREGKPINIERHIGRRPVVAVGNSSGDLEMLTYTKQNALLSLCLLVNHNDAEREYAYDFGQKMWNAAQSQDWIIINMKEDFANIF